MSPTHGLPNRLVPPSSTPLQPHETTSPIKNIPPPHSAAEATSAGISSQINTPVVSSALAKHNITSAAHHFQPIPGKFAFHHLPAAKLIPASAFPVSVIKSAGEAIKHTDPSETEKNGLSQSSGEDSPSESPKLVNNDAKHVFTSMAQKVHTGPSLVVSTGMYESVKTNQSYMLALPTITIFFVFYTTS